MIYLKVKDFHLLSKFKCRIILKSHLTKYRSDSVMGIYIYSAAVFRCFWLCGHMDCRPPGFSVHGDSPGTNIGVGCHVLLQGIFTSQGLNPGLPHCRQTLYQLSHQESPSILEWVAYLFSRGFSWPRNKPGVSHCRWILYQLSYPGNLMCIHPYL